FAQYTRAAKPVYFSSQFTRPPFHPRPSLTYDCVLFPILEYNPVWGWNRFLLLPPPPFLRCASETATLGATRFRFALRLLHSLLGMAKHRTAERRTACVVSSAADCLCRDLGEICLLLAAFLASLQLGPAVARLGDSPDAAASVSLVSTYARTKAISVD